MKRGRSWKIEKKEVEKWKLDFFFQVKLDYKYIEIQCFYCFEKVFFQANKCFFQESQPQPTQPQCWMLTLKTKAKLKTRLCSMQWGRHYLSEISTGPENVF